MTHGNEDEGLSFVVRRLVYGQVEDQTRRHNIFKTRCIVNQRVYDVTIDSCYSQDFFLKNNGGQSTAKDREAHYTLQDWLTQQKTQRS